MTTNISSHTSWQKIKEESTTIKINKQNTPSLFLQIISSSNLATFHNTQNVDSLYVDIYEKGEWFCLTHNHKFELIGASPDVSLIYFCTNKIRFQQFLQSLDGPALAEYAILRMQRG